MVVNSLRSARISDLGELVQLIQVNRERLTPCPSEKTLRKKILSGEAVYQAGVLILFRRHPKRYSLAGLTFPAGSLEIQHVVSRYKGRGYGTEVLRSFLASHGGSVFLNVFSDNPSVHLYERLGFKCLGEKEWACGVVRYYLLEGPC